MIESTNPLSRNTTPPATGPKLDIATLPYLKCEDCGSMNFQQSLSFKTLSSLHPANTTGKIQVVPIEIISCLSCDRPVKELVPPGYMDEWTSNKIGE